MAERGMEWTTPVRWFRNKVVYNDEVTCSLPVHVEHNIGTSSGERV